MTTMILVTGAAGKTGLAVIQALARRGVHVRALVRRTTQAAAVQQRGAQSVVVGDLLQATTLRAALAGCQAVYHICPNMHPQEAVIGEMMLAAAMDAGISHFVYHSVLHPQTEAMPHHWLKLRVEEQLFTAGLPYTILQPCAYMHNILGSWQAITRQGVYPTPYPVTTRLSLVDLADVAEVAARVLTEPGHQAATYELVGVPSLTQTEVAAALSQDLGQPIKVEELSLAAWEARARAAGMSDYALDTLLRMFRYYAAYGLVGNPTVLTHLLGRAPTSLAAFLAHV